VAERHSVGAHCRDEALVPLGITREESFEIPSAWGCVIGLDLESVRSCRFLDDWAALAADRVTFTRPKWSGVRGYPRTASADPRINGHRSQSAMSVLALRHGMDRWHTKSQFSAYFRADRQFVRQFDEGSPPAGSTP
jgi:hypothetical protein